MVQPTQTQISLATSPAHQTQPQPYHPAPHAGIGGSVAVQ